ncbi:MAG: hypothetical protein OEX77_04835 [Candidatus Bathyarchaeota archaeon]|nr:hypothetical protein [Candidatus Bathyarchaeota archaeon]MDH5733434.1 hypothetical protein [Candidatus Bathyarchaeota archaeon]
MLFREKHIKKIMRAEKTMTRRTHKRTFKVGGVYGIRSWYLERPKHYVKITSRFRQRLGDMTFEDVRKEGYETFEDFKRAWIEINGEWGPDQLVWVYEFEVTDSR